MAVCVGLAARLAIACALLAVLVILTPPAQRIETATEAGQPEAVAQSAQRRGLRGDGGEGAEIAAEEGDKGEEAAKKEDTKWEDKNKEANDGKKKDDSNGEETHEEQRSGNQLAEKAETHEEKMQEKDANQNAAKEDHDQGKSGRQTIKGKSEHVAKEEDGEEPEKTQAWLGECVDDHRVQVKWTNATCVTLGMLQKVENPYFLASCGHEAMLMKATQYRTMQDATFELLKLGVAGLLFSMVPLVLSSMAFQSLYGSPSVYEPLSDGQSKSGWDKFKETVGRIGHPLFLAGIVCLNIYTTVTTTRRVISEVAEMKGEIHFGGWCNFFLYLNYGRYKEIMEVLILAVFTWSDMIFTVCKVLHDFGLIVGSFVCTYACSLKCFFCCTWCHLVNCKCILLFLLFAACAIPIIIGLVVLSFAILAYEMFALAAVFIVYGAGSLLLIFIALFFVYLLSVVIALVLMPCGKGKLQTPVEFYSGALQRLAMEAGSGTDKKMEQAPATTLLTMKAYSVIIPFVTFFTMFYLQTGALEMIESFTFASGNLSYVEELNNKAHPQSVPETIWAELLDTFGAVSEFLHLYFVEIPGEAVPLYHTVKKCFRWEVMLTLFASLLDVGSKFESFKKAVFAMRVGNGLLMGPLRLFELLAKYDKVA